MRVTLKFGPYKKIKMIIDLKKKYLEIGWRVTLLKNNIHFGFSKIMSKPMTCHLLWNVV